MTNDAAITTDLEVIAQSFNHSSREPDHYSEWDRGTTWTDWTVSGIRLAARYPDITVDFQVKPGEVVHLIYATYSTGDSFGRDENGRIDYILVHKNRELAEKNVELLRAKTNKDQNYTVNLTTDTGIVIPYYVPWLGYFQSLTDVYVEAFLVK
jgi:hypothetical protein